MSEQFEADYKLTCNLEILTDKLQHTYRQLESEKQKTDRLILKVSSVFFFRLTNFWKFFNENSTIKIMLLISE